MLKATTSTNELTAWIVMVLLWEVDGLINNNTNLFVVGTGKQERLQD